MPAIRKTASVPSSCTSIRAKLIAEPSIDAIRSNAGSTNLHFGLASGSVNRATVVFCCENKVRSYLTAPSPHISCILGGLATSTPPVAAAAVEKLCTVRAWKQAVVPVPRKSGFIVAAERTKHLLSITLWIPSPLAGINGGERNADEWSMKVSIVCHSRLHGPRLGSSSALYQQF